jgi:hypothetical protein
MAHRVMCRICKQTFDAGELPDTEWVMPTAKWYYHTKCYENWIKNRNNAKANIEDENFWYQSLVEYLYRDVKMSIDFNKLVSQWRSFIKPDRHMTPKGIYFAMRYFYDIQKGDIEKSQGGIGIVPSIYRQSCEYWQNREMEKAGTIDAIVAEIAARNARPVQMILQKKKEKKNKAKWSLDEI